MNEFHLETLEKKFTALSKLSKFDYSLVCLEFSYFKAKKKAKFNDN